MTPDVDVCVVGAGIVGLATARALSSRFEGIGIAVIEKESDVGTHQTGHNSGVLHSGLYYRPGSLKARLCVRGRRSMEEFCEAEGLPMRRSGKIVIATSSEEVPALEELHRRGVANGLVGVDRVGPDGLRDVEPHATGVAGLVVPETGVADFGAVARRLADGLTAAGASLATGAAVEALHERDGVVEVVTSAGATRARLVVNCAGLHADRVARLAGIEPGVRIVPFRGEYYELAAPAAALVRELIYPVPDPRFPFLGVHFTRRVDGAVEVGPNAVLAFGREHYRGTRADYSHLWSTLRYAGFRRLARRYWRMGLTEMLGSVSKRSYAARARRLVPELRAAHLRRAGSGVRAQAVTADGKLVDDFVIEATERVVSVLNAPSPAATSSLAIGEHIAGLVAPRLE